MKKIIITKKAPAPIGPYNQAVLVGGTLYTSGQIAINPATGELVLDTIEKEIHVHSLPVPNFYFSDDSVDFYTYFQCNFLC